jgi:hypothetical protein
MDAALNMVSENLPVPRRAGAVGRHHDANFVDSIRCHVARQSLDETAPLPGDVMEMMTRDYISFQNTFHVLSGENCQI